MDVKHLKHWIYTGDGNEVECFGALREAQNYDLTFKDGNNDCTIYVIEPAPTWIGVIKNIMRNYDFKPTELVEIVSHTSHSDIATHLDIMKPYR